ncbi:hypothetical protein RvY_10845 [Ramazzottius varieornatus]|uniref:Uncharacterized protein n=1 Tax=Ramazzottius varieornatus TaxID=947166 RepID=A0A1D1VG60_RAMVA|nr:hypothetical protein RvY_10845 [Ramazzottius varieornatus]
MEPPHTSDTLRTSAEAKASEDEEEENEASGPITYNNALEPEVDFSCGLLELPENVSPVATSQLITGFTPRLYKQDQLAVAEKKLSLEEKKLQLAGKIADEKPEERRQQRQLKNDHRENDLEERKEVRDYELKKLELHFELAKKRFTEQNVKLAF